MIRNLTASIATYFGVVTLSSFLLVIIDYDMRLLLYVTGDTTRPFYHDRVHLIGSFIRY